jgi:hypothetical protein
MFSAKKMAPQAIYRTQNINPGCRIAELIRELTPEIQFPLENELSGWAFDGERSLSDMATPFALSLYHFSTVIDGYAGDRTGSWRW